MGEVYHVHCRTVLIVQKYGGTSVGSIERMKNVAARYALDDGRVTPTPR